MIKKLWPYSGVVGVLVLWTGVTVGMNRAGLGLVDPRPISYLGVDPKSAVLFSTSLLVSALLFVSFGYYVKRHFHVNNRFLTYLLIGQAGQAVAAVAPYGKNSPYKMLHTIAAFVLAFSLPFLIRQFALSQVGKPYHQKYVWLLKFEQIMFVIGIGLFIFTKGIAPIGEAMPTIGFHLWILVVTVISLKRGKQH